MKYSVLRKKGIVFSCIDDNGHNRSVEFNNMIRRCVWCTRGDVEQKIAVALDAFNIVSSICEVTGADPLMICGEEGRDNRLHKYTRTMCERVMLEKGYTLQYLSVFMNRRWLRKSDIQTSYDRHNGELYNEYENNWKFPEYEEMTKKILSIM